jgi:hypothetical protein
MIMKVAKEPEPPCPLGLSYVLNIDAFFGSIVTRLWAQVPSRDVNTLVKARCADAEAEVWLGS